MMNSDGDEEDATEEAACNLSKEGPIMGTCGTIMVRPIMGTSPPSWRASS